MIKNNTKGCSSEDGLLTNDKVSICKRFLKQFNSVFSTPNACKVVIDPIAFSTTQTVPSHNLTP